MLTNLRKYELPFSSNTFFQLSRVWYKITLNTYIIAERIDVYLSCLATVPSHPNQVMAVCRLRCLTFKPVPPLKPTQDVNSISM